MKVIAIGGRGKRRDFVGRFFLLRGGVTLDAVFELLRRRFERLDHTECHLLRSLVSFDEAETEAMPRPIGRASWHEIEVSIVAEVRRVARAAAADAPAAYCAWRVPMAR